MGRKKHDDGPVKDLKDKAKALSANIGISPTQFIKMYAEKNNIVLPESFGFTKIGPMLADKLKNILTETDESVKVFKDNIPKVTPKKNTPQILHQHEPTAHTVFLEPTPVQQQAHPITLIEVIQSDIDSESLYDSISKYNSSGVSSAGSEYIHAKHQMEEATVLANEPIAIKIATPDNPHNYVYGPTGIPFKDPLSAIREDVFTIKNIELLTPAGKQFTEEQNKAIVELIQRYTGIAVNDYKAQIPIKNHIKLDNMIREDINFNPDKTQFGYTQTQLIRQHLKAQQNFQ